MVKAFWHLSDNFGDKITPYLHDFQYVDKHHSEEHYIMCGSVLPAANEQSIIWGAGIAQDHPDIDWRVPKKIIAVRGKWTRKILLNHGIECPKLYGDPAMMLPKLYFPDITKTGKIAFVGNVIDTRKSDIDIRQDVEPFIDQLLAYEKIHTSSLHALIAADAYGLKSQWYPYAGEGGLLKFTDYIQTNYDIDKFIESYPL